VNASCARHTILGAALVAVLLPAATPVPAADGGLEEIVVSARRREESLQHVPAQVSVLSSEVIENAQIRNFTDFASMTPNMQGFENFRRGVYNLTIRGIPTVQGGEPPATILVDGVQLSSLEFVNQDLYDIEQIQIVRGPLGSVYGRGAIGGAILIDTRQPTDEHRIDVNASYAGEIDEARLGASASGPLSSDRVHYNAAAAWNHTDGHIDNPFLDTTCNFINERMVRGGVDIEFSDTVSLEASGGYLNGRNGASCILMTTDADPFFNDGEDVPDEIPRDFRQYDDRELYHASVKLDWELGFATLTSVTSYQESDSYSPGDVDFTAFIVPFIFENPVTVEAWNQDLRLTSSDTGPLTWMTGAFYQDRDTFNGLDVHSVPPLPPITLLSSAQQDDSEAWAVYGQVSYDILPNLELSAALRYDEDQRNSEDENLPGSAISETFDKVQPSASLAYYWTDELMFYASGGVGFRSGGFNAVADSAAVGLPDRMFPAESATNYEAGFRGTFLDGRLRLSAAGFYTDFENQHFFFIDVANTARVIVTFPETRIIGAELEAVAKPTDALDLRFAFGLADGEIEDGGTRGDLDGNHSPNSHEYTLNLSAQYTWPVAATMDLRGRVDYEHRGPIYYDELNAHKFEETDFVNLGLFIEADTWSIGGFAKNLTDERIPTFFGVNSFGPGVHGYIQNLPRHYGVEFRWHY
jgi:iron complex outermembrane receptor protein